MTFVCRKHQEFFKFLGLSLRKGFRRQIESKETVEPNKRGRKRKLKKTHNNRRRLSKAENSSLSEEQREFLPTDDAIEVDSSLTLPQEPGGSSSTMNFLPIMADHPVMQARYKAQDSKYKPSPKPRAKIKAPVCKSKGSQSNIMMFFTKKELNHSGSPKAAQQLSPSGSISPLDESMDYTMSNVF